MILKNVRFSGIGQFENQVEFDFSDGVNVLRGDNNQGKTTLAAAIVYAITGRTLGGSPHVDDLINCKAKRGEVFLTVDVSGEVHEIYRCRDNTTKTTKNTVLLDGEKADEVKLMHIFRDWQLFLAAFLPPFIHQLEPKKASELLRQILPKIKAEQVKAEMDNADNLKGLDLADPPATQKQLRAEIKTTLAEIERMNGSIETLGQIAEKEIPEAAEAIDITVLQEQIQGITAQVEGIKAGDQQIDVSTLEIELDRLRGEYVAIKGEIQELPAPPSAGNNAICPTCGQNIGGDALEKALAKHEETCQKITAQNDQRIKRLAAITDQAKKIKEQIDDAILQNAVTEKPDPAFLDMLETERAELQQQINATMQANAQRNAAIEQRQEATDKLVNLEEELKLAEDDARRKQLEVDALGEFVNTKVRLIGEAIKNHLSRASVNLFEIVKSTGEMKPIFELTFDGQPFAGMSNSNRIRCGLEVSNLVNKLTGLDFPVYIDNAEAITQYEQQPGQVFAAYVTEGKNLTVNDAEPTHCKMETNKGRRGKAATE